LRKIAVLMGGLSSEREVSLKTGANVHKALLEKKHEAITIDWAPGSDLPALLRDAAVDTVWIALHGTWGEDGCVQGLLECLKLPYTGSGVLASALAMDKALSKRIFGDEGIPTPAWRILGVDEDPASGAATFGYPVVVKPSREGSTVGVTIVEDEAKLADAVALARRCHGVTLLEKYIAGRELSVGILDGAVLGTVEIRPRAAYYDYEAKYVRGDTEYLVPAPLDSEAEQAVKEAALDAHEALACSGHSRVDLRLSPEGEVFVLEVNTLPGMTGTSLLPKIAAHAGLDYAGLVEKIALSARLHA
jgi:D-alanine-D-alanine ligase